MNPANWFWAPRRFAERYLPAKTVNFWCHVFEGAFASFGGEIVAGGIIFSVLAGALGATPFVLGLLTSIGGLTFLTPFLFAPRIEAVRRKKRLVLLLGIGQRMPVLLTAVCLIVLAERSPLACLVAKTVVRLAGGFFMSVLAGPWVSLLAETVRQDRIGRLQGFRNAISSGMGLLSGPACAVILAAVVFPWNYSVLYIVGFLVMGVSWFLFALVDEVPDDSPPKHRVRARYYYKDLLKAFFHDRNYRWFMLHNALGRTGLVVTPFYALMAIRMNGVSQAFAAGAFIAANSAARVVGNLVLPFFGERVGSRKMVTLALLFQAGAALFAAFAPSGMWFIGVFFLSGLGMAAGTVGGMAFQISILPGNRRIGYMSLSSVVLAPLGMAAAPLAGLLIERLGHQFLFSFASVMILAAVIPLSRCVPMSERSETDDE